MDLSVLIEPTLDLERLTQVLDTFGHEGRLHCVRGWDRKKMEKLYAAAKGYMKLDLSHFVPDSIGPLTEVIHHGKNSLPAFSHFQKRFAKPTPGAEAEGKLWGYNHQVAEWLAPVIGPGYFTARLADASVGEGVDIDIDYKILPPEKCESWPPIEDNNGRGKLVYAGMTDHMRKLSHHVSIGRAEKGGKLMDAWFVLVREDVS